MSGLDSIALWVLAFGVWPFADPGHGGDSLLSVLDIALHAAAAVVLISRWKVVRRNPASKRGATA